MLEVVARIARAVRVPVTADMEAGYGNNRQRHERNCKGGDRCGCYRPLNSKDVTGEDESSQVNVALQVQKIKRYGDCLLR